jgi:hypothetical protein
VKQPNLIYVIKECRTHGATDHAARDNGRRWRCRKCESEAVNVFCAAMIGSLELYISITLILVRRNLD